MQETVLIEESRKYQAQVDANWSDEEILDKYENGELESVIALDASVVSLCGRKEEED